MTDVVRELGYLCLGSRLKRIGERMQANVQSVLDGQSIPVQAAHYPLLATIEKLGPSTIGTLVKSLDASQPGVTRSVANLTEQGLLEIRPNDGDQRHKIVALSRRGHALIRQSELEIWPHIESVLIDLCHGKNESLIDQLTNIEDALLKTPLHQRINAALDEAGS